jgi:3-deoxy-D-manno-octulosonate 8-phosphate phosphatase (KDO 8-P phosphatase)
LNITMTNENLTALAASGAPNAQIVAALGRKMTPEERQIVERVRVVKRLKRVQAAGVKLAFISQSRTSYIATRARDLGVDFCYTGIENKLETMTDILSQLDFGLEAVAHIADDVNDLSLLRAVGLPITVPGGMPEVKSACRFVTQAAGGNGAVRELCEAILLAKEAQDAV